MKRIDHKKLYSLIIIWLENMGVGHCIHKGQTDDVVHGIKILMPGGPKRSILCYSKKTIVRAREGSTCISALMYGTGPTADVIRLNPEDPDFLDRIAKHLKLPA